MATHAVAMLASAAPVSGGGSHEAFTVSAASESTIKRDSGSHVSVSARKISHAVSCISVNPQVNAISSVRCTVESVGHQDTDRASDSLETQAHLASSRRSRCHYRSCLRPASDGQTPTAHARGPARSGHAVLRTASARKRDRPTTIRFVVHTLRCLSRTNMVGLAN